MRLKRRTEIILCITATRVVRADFPATGARDPAPPWVGDRVGGASLAETARRALSRGGPVNGARVILISDDFWAQETTLNAVQLEGLSPAELARALSYEIEPFSNVPAAKGMVGWLPVQQGSGAITYWVVEATETEIATLGQMVAGAGGRLVAVTHPGTSPLHGKEGMQPPALPPDGETGERPWREWSAGWRDAIRSRRVALVEVPDASGGAQRQMAVGLALALAAGVLCLVHFGVLEYRLHRAAREVSERNALAAQLALLDQECNQLSQSINESGQRLRRLEETAASLMCQRGAVPALLHGLGDHPSSETVIQEIKDAGHQACVAWGLSSSASAPESLAAELGRRLAPAGWIAQRLHKEALNLLPGGGPWRFSIRFTRQHPLGEMVIATPTQAGGGAWPD